MIELTSAEISSEGRDLYVNPDHIIVITPAGKGTGSRIGTTATENGGQTYFHHVREDPKEVIALINRARSNKTGSSPEER